MIQFTLKCSAGHSFDSWFKSGAAYDSLRAAGMVSCAICGGTEVDKAIMAPAVSTRKTPDPTPDPTPALMPAQPTPPAPSPSLSTPESPQEQAIAALRAHVETHSEDVGTRFVEEARAMHAGDRTERSIYGQASGEDARKLIEDGIPVAPLPFVPKRKTN
ncbi:MAG: DUF1178 family protein [Primorskyibacter sp.]